MENLRRGTEIKTKFGAISGVENGLEWNLNVYVRDIKFQKTQVKIYFIHKFTINFEIMSQLHDLFDGCGLRVEAEEDRLVLVIGGL